MVKEWTLFFGLIFGYLISYTTFAETESKHLYSFTLTGIGITVHGKTISTDAARLMKYKILENGRASYNPQFGLILKTEHWQSTLIYLQDCFNHPAGIAGIGPKLDIGSYLSFGLVGGVYIRKSLDPTLAMDFPIEYKTHGVELIPYGAFTTSFEIPLSKNISLETNIGINYFLNHINEGLKIKF